MAIFNAVEKRFGLASGTLFFILCTLFVKGIGFLYKIPLYNSLGTFGSGLYQTVFPVYSFAINLSGAGIPTSITKLIASGKNAKAVLEKTLLIFSVAGLLLSLSVFSLSGIIAKTQGNVSAKYLYFAISPSIFIVSIISCFRGYFQGLTNFKPTAVSQVIEQCVKAVVGISFFTFSNGDCVKKATYACVAVTFSELVALAYLLVKYLNCEKRRTSLVEEKSREQEITLKTLLKLVLPVSAVALSMPFAEVIDSLTVVNLLSVYARDKATDVYGIYAGGIQTLIALPVSLLHVITIGYLPKMSKDNGQSGQKLLAYIAILSVCFFVAFQIFPSLIIKLLFASFSNYGELICELIKVSAVNVIFLSLLSASNTVLLAMNKQFFSLISTSFGLVVKTIMNFNLVSIPQLNAFGLVLSDLSFYAVTLSINLFKIFRVNKSVNSVMHIRDRV